MLYKTRGLVLENSIKAASSTSTATPGSPLNIGTSQNGTSVQAAIASLDKECKMSKIIEKGTPKELIAEAALGIPSNAIARNYIFKRSMEPVFPAACVYWKTNQFLADGETWYTNGSKRADLAGTGMFTRGIYLNNRKYLYDPGMS